MFLIIFQTGVVQALEWPMQKYTVRRASRFRCCWYGPKAPEGKESNWIPTGEDFFLLFRLYGPADGWIESGWKLPDVEKVD